jgi:hypothetical protein
VLQNIEEQVTFDTVPNVKKQHQVNIGEVSHLVYSLLFSLILSSLDQERHSIVGSTKCGIHQRKKSHIGRA